MKKPREFLKRCQKSGNILSRLSRRLESRGVILQIFELFLLSPTSESFASSKRGGARGFHEGIFDQGFGGFSTLKKRGGSRLEAVRAAASRLKRRPEMTSRGIHGDAFTGDIVDLQ